MAGITPDRVLHIIKCARRGDLEQLFDLFAYVLETDSHIRGVYETLLRNVVSAQLRFDEGTAETDALAKATVEFQRESLDMLPQYERAVMHLAHGHGIGIAICEKEWGRVKGTRRVIAIRPVAPRDTKFADDWTPMVRTHPESGSSSWIRVDAEPMRWIVHVPGAVGLRPQMAGILLPCLLPWVFKKFATIYSQQTLERFATPLIIATLDERAPNEVLDQVVEDLENITATSAGAIRASGKIEVINSSAGQAGQAHKIYIELFESQITKGILGSGLNTDGGSDGGSYAMAQSQASTTVLPRVQSIADGVAETLREQWFAQELKVNAHRFNGNVPEPAGCFFELTQDAAPVIDTNVIGVGAATVDEVRQFAGLEPWGAEKGGDRIAKLLSAAAPGSADFAEASDTGADEAAAGVTLNGAQVASLLEIVNRVGMGTIPRETGIMLMTSAFPITRALAEKIMGDIGLAEGASVDDAAAVLESLEEAPPPKPLGRMSRPHSPKTSRTSRTSYASTTQIDNVPLDR